MIWKGMIEPGLNLEIQEFHWKGELISVEIDIKIIGNGCTVSKWQAQQEWCYFAINSMMPLRMQKETKLPHTNITINHMAVMYKRCLTKHEH